MVQGMAWWKMIATCRDAKDNLDNTINCVWGAITSAITISAAGVNIYISYGKIMNAYINPKRDLASHPQLQGLLDELANMTGHEISYHGLWDHAKLGLNYSEVVMEDENPLHIFGLKASDGSQSHFTYLGNSTGIHSFRLGMGAPSTTVSNSTVKTQGALTINNEVSQTPKCLHHADHDLVLSMWWHRYHG